MNYSFHPDAELEFVQAIDYYEECLRGLGNDFAIEVHDTVKRIITNPQAWQVLEGNIRRSLVNRFPYGILYVYENNEILILAVMHLHRSPDYLKERK